MKSVIFLIFGYFHRVLLAIFLLFYVLITYFIILLIALLPIVKSPLKKVLHGLACLLQALPFSFIAVLFSAKRQKIVNYNLSIVYPEKSKQEIESLSQQFLTKFLLNMLYSFALIFNTSFVNVTSEGKEPIDDQSTNTSSIMLAAHMLYLIFNIRYIMHRFRKFYFYILYAKGTNPLLNKLHLWFYQKIAGVDNIHFRGRSEGRSIQFYTESLKSNPGMFFYAYDQLIRQKEGKDFEWLSKQTYPISFFNQETVGYSIPFVLARETNSNIYYCESKEVGFLSYHLKFHCLDKFKEDHLNVQELYSLLEASIKRDPLNYLWSHDRFDMKKLLND